MDIACPPPIKISGYAPGWQQGFFSHRIKLRDLLQSAVIAALPATMGAIWWGTRGTRPPTFSDGWDMICHVPPHFFLLRFCIGRGFTSKSDVCHALCEELFMLDGRPHVAKLMFETVFGVVSLMLLVYKV